MSGGNKRKSQKNNKKQDKAEEQPVMEEISEHDDASELEEDAVGKMEQEHTVALRVRLAYYCISKDIKEFKQEI